MPSDWSRVSCTIQCIIYENDLNDIATCFKIHACTTYYLLYYLYQSALLNKDICAHSSNLVDSAHKVGKEITIRYCAMAQIARNS